MNETDESKRLRILHIATGLDAGGAERVLERLVVGMDSTRFNNKVVSLTSYGNVADSLEQKGFDVEALEIPRQLPNLPHLIKLGRCIRNAKPDIIQTWMYHADILGGIMGKLVTDAPVLWNLRQTTLDPIVTRRSLLLTTRLGAWLSSTVPFTIVCGSHAARLVHQDVGYTIDNTQVIPNGHDSDLYKPDPTAGTRVRKELGIEDDTLLVGMPARFHPQKDHPTFIEAARLLHQRRPGIAFVLFGENIDNTNLELTSMIAEAGLSSHFYLAGRKGAMETYYPALDLAVLSSSFGEGAPNVLGEAMLCGVPCVATDIGDCALIVGDTGKIVEPTNPKALSDAMHAVLEKSAEGRKELGLRARDRIKRRFGLSSMIQRYEDLYQRVASQQLSRDRFSA